MIFQNSAFDLVLLRLESGKLLVQWELVSHGDLEKINLLYVKGRVNLLYLHETMDATSSLT
jgi:hypothetical protein